MTMLEIPESHTISEQLRSTVVGKTILRVYVGSPHGFAFYSGDPSEYDGMLSGLAVDGAQAHGGLIEMSAGNMRVMFGDGVNIRHSDDRDKIPKKYQMLFEFDDLTFITCSVQMYGGIWCFKAGEDDNFYHNVARERPSPLTDTFDHGYFTDLANGNEKLSAKAFLATEQRIPGLGNGCLQDILFNCGIDPRRKMGTFDQNDLERMFTSMKDTLKDMTDKGGRDTERDLFGTPGGYRTLLSSKTYGAPCPRCSSDIVRKPYMGGNVYFCPECQR